MDLVNMVAEGNTARIYLHEDKIVKVFKSHLPDTEAIYEAEKQRYAYTRGLPVPVVYDVAMINGKQAIIMEYIKGRTLGEMLFSDRERTEEYMSLSVNTQMRMHEIVAGRGIECMKDKLARQINAADALDDGQKSSLLKLLVSMTFEDRLCHGDFHIFNLIMSECGIKIIDWVDASAGDVRSDAYRSYFLYSQFSVELACLYLRLYCEKSGVAKEEVMAWAPIIAGARLSEGVSGEKAEYCLEIVKQYCG